MSLAINVTTAEGLVLSTDSRQSYRNQKGQARIGSDSASKLFKLSSRVGTTATGPAFLPEGQIPKNVSKFIDDFKRGNELEELSVKEIAEKLGNYFDEKYPYREQVKNPPANLKQDLEGQGLRVLEMSPKEKFVEFKFQDTSGNTRTGRWAPDQLSFIVAGYNSNGSHGVYMVYVPGDIEEKRNSEVKGKEYGASWTGQIDVVARIVLGRDPRVMDQLILKGLVKPDADKNKVKEFMNSLEYVISWGTMTLQDAVDFASLMIETTSAIQRFSDGVAMNPGDIPGVGGPIDIAVITPDKGFVWVSKKSLVVGEKELDLERVPNLFQEKDEKLPQKKITKKTK